MALSAISNVPFTKNPVSQQKSETAAEQSNNGSGLSSGKNNAEKSFDDTVTLSPVAEVATSEKTADLSQTIDTIAAQKILPETMKAILADSRTAVSAQANVSTQAAQEFLGDK